MASNEEIAQLRETRDENAREDFKQNQILRIYEDDNAFAQYVGVENYRSIRDNDPKDLDRLRNSVYFGAAYGDDPMDVFNSYDEYSQAKGFTGDSALDGNSIRRSLQQEWKKANVAESLYEGYTSATKEGWLNYEDQWTTRYLTSPNVRDQANSLPKEIVELQERFDAAETPWEKAQAEAELKKAKTMLRATTIGRARAAQNRLENDIERQSLRFSEQLLKLQSAKGVGEKVRETGVVSLSQVILRSMVEQGPAMPLTIATAPLTGGLGLGASSAAGAFSQEVSAGVEQELAALGIDLTNLEALDQQIADNEEEIQAAYVKAGKKAIPVAIAAMIGGKNFGGKNLVSAGARDLGAQTTLDVMGETLGQLWSTGDVEAAEAYMEAIAGIGSNVAEFGSKATAGLVTDRFKGIAQREDGSPLSKEDWENVGQAVSDVEVSELGLNPLEESLTILAKNGDTNAQSMASQMLEDTVEAEAKRPAKEASTPFFERMAVAVEKAGTVVDKGIQKMVSISTRIGEISKAAKLRVEKIDQQTTILSNEGTKASDPFIDSSNRVIRGLSKEERDNVRAEMLNGDFEALAKRGIANIERLRKFLSKRASMLPDVTEIENYFPRKVTDLDGLYDHLGKQPDGPFSKSIKEATEKNGSELTREERIAAVNKELRKKSGEKPGHLKARSVEKVTPEMVKFYADPLETLRIYNHRISELIAKREFLGENVINLHDIDADPDISTEAIAKFVNERLGDFTPSQEQELRTLLASRLNFSKGGDFFDRLMRKYRTGVSLKYVSGLKTIMVQLSDLSVNWYENGARDMISNAGKRAKYVDAFGNEVKATLESVGIDAIDQELKESLKTKAGVSRIILSGLRTMDMAMKQNLLSTVSKRWQRMASKSPESLKAEMMSDFGDAKFVDGVIKDLKRKKLTPDLNFAFFVKLSEYHPTGVSQHTKFYIDNPKMRGLFVLKSFAFKRFDLIYRDAIQGVVRGMSDTMAGTLRGDVKATVGGAARMGSGLASMGKILASMYAFETFVEMVYYAITPNQDDDEQAFLDLYLDNVASIVPFFNVWEFKRGLDRGKLFEGIMAGFAPPSPLGADPLGELIESMYENKPYDWNELETEIPWIGQLLREEKESKSNRSTLFD